MLVAGVYVVCYSAKTVVPPTHAFADPNRKRMFLPEYIRQCGCERGREDVKKRIKILK